VLFYGFSEFILCLLRLLGLSQTGWARTPLGVGVYAREKHSGTTTGTGLTTLTTNEHIVVGVIPSQGMSVSKSLLFVYFRTHLTLFVFDLIVFTGMGNHSSI